jgi:hypothetical protein
VRDYLARQMLFELALRRASGNPRSVANPISDPRLKQLLQQAPQVPAFLSEARDKEDAERREAARSPQISAISEADYRASGTLWRLQKLSEMIAGGVAMSPAERHEYEDIVNAQVFGERLREWTPGFFNPAFNGYGNLSDILLVSGFLAPGPGTTIDRLGQWRAGEPTEGARTELVLPSTPETFLDKNRTIPGVYPVGSSRSADSTRANSQLPASVRNLRPGQPLPDRLEIVVRGSSTNPNTFILRPGVDDVPIGMVTTPGKSATIATDLTFDTEISQMFGRAPGRGDVLSGGFVEDIRAAGFDVMYAPTAANPLHVRIVPAANHFDPSGRELLSKGFDVLGRKK